MDHPTIILIILTYNQKEETLRCLKSCFNICDISYKIILWDNGSTDNTIETVNKIYPNVITCYNNTNLGVAAGRNAAAAEALKLSPDYLLFLDNDTVVEPEFLFKLYRDLSGSEYSIASPKIKLLNNTKYLYGAGGLEVVFKKGKTVHMGYNEVDLGQYDNQNNAIPSGGCMLVKKEVFIHLIGFDEIFSPYGPEDIDFVLRAKKAGYKSLYVPKSVIYHKSEPNKTGQQSFIYFLRRIYHWIIILKRHAPLYNLIEFLLLYGPLASFRRIVTKFK